MNSRVIIRISSSDYSVYNHAYIMNVEVLDTLDKAKDCVYIVFVPQNQTYTLDNLKSYIEKEIAFQKKHYTPDFTGVEWSSALNNENQSAI